MEQSAQAPLTSTNNEAALILRARANEARAWQTLVETHQQPVFRLALLITGDPDDAADVAQDAFLRAYRKLARFDPSRAFGPWILAITSRLASNRRRSAGRYLHLLTRWHLEAAHKPPGRGGAPSELWRALQRLKAMARQVVYLRYFLGLSEAETALVLGIPGGTVKSRTARALRKLGDIIETHYPELKPGQDDG